MYFLIISIIEVMFPSVIVCWLDFRQDYTKTTEGISTILGRRMGLNREETPLNFGTDKDIFL